MTKKAVRIVGSGDLAYRTNELSSANGHETIHLADNALRAQGSDDATFDALTHGLRRSRCAALERWLGLGP